MRTPESRNLYSEVCEVKGLILLALFFSVQGPKGLGDPNYRGLTKMETDPMIPQRMRDEARTSLCTEAHKAMIECGKDAVNGKENYEISLKKLSFPSIFGFYFQGLAMPFKCTKERDGIVECISMWLDNDDFREGITKEYLNERSHYRETGRTKFQFALNLTEN